MHWLFYLGMLLSITGASLAVFNWSVRHESQISSNQAKLLIGVFSWLGYGAAAALIAWVLGLNILLAFGLGLLGATAGPYLGFLIGLYKNPNGVK